MNPKTITLVPRRGPVLSLSCSHCFKIPTRHLCTVNSAFKPGSRLLLTKLQANVTVTKPDRKSNQLFLITKWQIQFGACFAILLVLFWCSFAGRTVGPSFFWSLEEVNLLVVSSKYHNQWRQNVTLRRTHLNNSLQSRVSAYLNLHSHFTYVHVACVASASGRSLTHRLCKFWCKSRVSPRVLLVWASPEFPI